MADTVTGHDSQYYYFDPDSSQSQRFPEDKHLVFQTTAAWQTTERARVDEVQSVEWWAHIIDGR